MSSAKLERGSVGFPPRKLFSSRVIHTVRTAHATAQNCHVERSETSLVIGGVANIRDCSLRSE